ncbi:50S ribosomal protein L17 [Verrucomicrobiota bacterium]
MRHRKKDSKLGRSSAHRKATLASLVCGLILEKRIKTTLAKAKQARSLAEKMVTVGRKYHAAESPGAKLAARRRAISVLGRKKVVALLIDEIAPGFEGRNGGYTRIVKVGRRRSDGSEMAILEWVGTAPPENKKKKSDSDKAAA